MKGGEGVKKIAMTKYHASFIVPYGTGEKGHFPMREKK